MALTRGAAQIAGLVSTSVAEGSAAERAALLGTLAKIRRNPFYTKCPMLLVTESVSTIDGSRYAEMFAGDPLVFAFRGTGPGKLRPGVGKAPAHEMTHLFQYNLSMGNCRYSANLITYDRPATGKDANTGVMGVRPLLERQMRNWQWHRDPLGQKPPKLHGKVGGEQDDLLITLLMVCYWAPAWRLSTRPVDVDWRADHGLA